jgi:hypothetical protein
MGLGGVAWFCTELLFIYYIYSYTKKPLHLCFMQGRGGVGHSHGCWYLSLSLLPTRCGPPTYCGPPVVVIPLLLSSHCCSAVVVSPLLCPPHQENLDFS